MNFNTRQLRAFVAVSEDGAFTTAARRLNLSQPALTVQIRNLEESLETKLFDRDTRSVALTRAGRELLPQFRRVLADLDATVDAARRHGSASHGTVRVAALPSVAASLLPDVIRAFREDNPHVAFDVKDAVNARIVAMVKEEVVDIGVIGQASVDRDLEIVARVREDMQVVFPVGHALQKVRNISLERLASYPHVLLTPETSVRRVVDAAFGARGLTIASVCEVTYMMAAVGMVRAGLGIAILPIGAREPLSEPAVRARRIDESGLVRTVAIIRRRKRTLSPIVSSFLDHLCARLAPGGAP